MSANYNNGHEVLTVEGIAPSLDKLESSFRPLTKNIPDDVEPAVTFCVIPESGE